MTRFLKGEVILVRGARSPGVYLITDGRVGLYHKLHPNVMLIRMATGGIFGGTWLIDELEHYDIV